MARVVVVGHVKTGTLCDALADACVDGARAAGHEASIFRTAEMAFDPILRRRFDAPQPLEPDLAAAAEALQAADHLVIVFPLWLGTMPAILKGFLERVLQPRLIESVPKGVFPKIMQGKTLRIVVTMGMPGLFYRLYFGAPAIRIIKRGVFGWLGMGRMRSTLFGMVDKAAKERVETWKREMAGFGRDLA